MKNIKALLLGAFAFGTVSLFAQDKKAEVHVSGNCGKCKHTIEKAAHVDGVKSATWDKKTKVLSLVYDDQKTSLDKVEQSVANSGYDTEKFKADKAAYSKLDECCQYDRD